MRGLTTCLFILWAASFSMAQEPANHDKAPVLHASRLTGKFTLDGELEEDIWSTAEVATHFLQKDPAEGQEATERTELRIAYDDSALYVAVRLYDSDPKSIVRRLSRRDDYSDSDLFTLYLDPRHDHLTGALFEISSAGVQRDGIISNDNFTDYSWDGVWESAVHIDDTGWSAELRIPFSQLRIAAGVNGIWGINASRFIHRKNETDWLELVPKKDSGLASRMAHLEGMAGLESSGGIDLMPYVVGRSEFLQPTGPQDPFFDHPRFFAGAGTDLKYHLSGSFTLDATVNPDFGQVEVDPAVVNLTAFPTFFDEKRPFFIEGSQIFNNFGRGGSNSFWGFNYAEPNLFYSRRIGRTPEFSPTADFVDSPQSTAIISAAKLTGKTQKGWSVGLVEAITAREYAKVQTNGSRSKTEVEPLTNYFVGRVEREMGTRAGVGMMMTGVRRNLDTTDLSNLLSKQAYAGGADAYYFLDSHKQWVVNGRLIGSWVSGSTAAVTQLQQAPQRYYQRPDVRYVHFDPNRTSLSGWSGVVRINRNTGKYWNVNAQVWGVSPGFESNDAGFHFNGDVGGAHGVLVLKKMDPDRWTRFRQLWIAQWWTWDYGRRMQGKGQALGLNVTFLNYWNANVNLNYHLRTLDDKLTRGGPVAMNPKGDSVWFNVGSDSRKKISFNLSMNSGKDDGGNWTAGGSLGLSLKPSSSILITTGPNYFRSRSVAQYVTTVADTTATYGNRYVFSDLDQIQGDLTTRVNWTLSPKMSLQVFTQPLISVGRYWHLKEFTQPGGYSFSRYGIDQGTIFPKDSSTYTIDPDGNGPIPSFDISNPDFNFKSLKVNAVFRWEWRLGSTFYLVWTQSRTDTQTTGQFYRSDLGKVFTSPPSNVFLARLAYWFGK
jgi:hypothetical protein